MKTRFDIEINDSDKILGGFLMTTEPMTKRHVIIFMTNLGRELMRNNRDIDKASYSAWEADNNDIDNAEHVCVIVRRSIRGVRATTF